MKKAVPMILSEDNFKQIFAFAEQYSKLAKALYNAALFRIRQVFTGWDKGDNRTPLEQSVFERGLWQILLSSRSFLPVVRQDFACK